MEIDELIQTMRLCTMAQVREQLQLAKDRAPVLYELITSFYSAASTNGKPVTKLTGAMKQCPLCKQDLPDGR